MKLYSMAAAMGRGLLAVLFLSCAPIASVRAGQFCDDHKPGNTSLPAMTNGPVCRQVRTSTGPGLAFASAGPTFSYADFAPESGLTQISFLLDLSQLNLGDKLHPNAELRIFELGFGLNQPVMPDNGVNGEPPVPNDGRAIALTVSGAESDRVLRFDLIATDLGFSPSMNWGITLPDGNSQTIRVPQGVSRVWVELDASSFGNTDWSDTEGTVRLLIPGQGWSSDRPLSFGLAWGESVRSQPIYILSGIVAGDMAQDVMTTTFLYQEPFSAALSE